MEVYRATRLRLAETRALTAMPSTISCCASRMNSVSPPSSPTAPHWRKPPNNGKQLWQFKT